MGNKSQASIPKIIKGLAVNEAAFEIRGYLTEGQPKSVIRFALGRVAEQHGVDAMEKVIEVLDLKEYLK